MVDFKIKAYCLYICVLARDNIILRFVTKYSSRYSQVIAHKYYLCVVFYV